MNSRLTSKQNLKTMVPGNSCLLACCSLHPEPLFLGVGMRDKLGRFVKGIKIPKEWRERWKENRKGVKNPHWKGGEIKSSQGYIFILQPKHPLALKSGYVKRANLVMEKMIGRCLKPGEIVHHKGVNFPLGSFENRQDDSPENLRLFLNRSEHVKFEKKQKGKIPEPSDNCEYCRYEQQKKEIGLWTPKS